MVKNKTDKIYKDVFVKLIVEIFEKGDNKPLNYKQVSAKLKLDDEEAKEALQQG